MAFSLQMPSLPENIPLSFYFVLIFGVFALLYFINRTLSEDRPIKGFPIVALTDQGLNAKASWFKKGRETVERGISTYDGPFQVLTGTGPKICLPNSFAEEVKDLPELSFTAAIGKDFFATYPGLSPFQSHKGRERLIPEVVRVKLTQSLGLVTNDLVDETTRAVHDLFGEDREWHELVLKNTVQLLVARLSSRVFLGERLCRNQRWLEIAKDYTVDAFIAARVLRMVPSLLRASFHWVIPYCRKVRKDYADAEKLITPEIEHRKDRARKAMAAGEKVPKTGDMIGWMYEVARERRESVNYVDGQLGLTLAAIHTTSEALSTTLLDIIEHAEILEPLRKEIIDVVGQQGWSKQALYKLRLMDSVLRESQRIHELNYVSMQRMATQPFKLSTGDIIPAGARIMVARRTRDPRIYTEPDKFSPYRFLRDGEASEKASQPTTDQHVSVNAQHMGWGYGEHSCPGRFFASNELKIALSHLLLKYEWRTVEDLKGAYFVFETNTSVSPSCRVEVRRRREEVKLDLDDATLAKLRHKS